MSPWTVFQTVLPPTLNQAPYVLKAGTRYHRIKPTTILASSSWPLYPLEPVRVPTLDSVLDFEGMEMMICRHHNYGPDRRAASRTWTWGTLVPRICPLPTITRDPETGNWSWSGCRFAHACSACGRIDHTVQNHFHDYRGSPEADSEALLDEQEYRDADLDVVRPGRKFLQTDVETFLDDYDMESSVVSVPQPTPIP